MTTLPPEPELCARLGVTAAEGVRAREVFCAAQALFLPMDLRVAVLASLLEGPDISVGPVYAGRMLALGPITHLGELLEADGIGMRRLADVARVLARRDPAELTPPQPDLRTEAAAAPSGGDAQSMRLTDIAASAGEQLDAARVGLHRARHPLALGDVQLTLRGGLAQDEAQHLAMRFDAEALPPEAASELVLRYALTAAAETPTAEATVPDVVGYTRALAERKLRDVGLGASAVFVIQDEPRHAGRVVRQRPAAGAPLPTGRVVTLQLGRPSRSPTP